MAKTYVYYKETNTDLQIQINLLGLLNSNETFVSVALGTPSPVSPTPLVSMLQTPPSDPSAVVDLRGGVHGVDYGIELLITTDARTFTSLIAIRVDNAIDQINPYSTGVEPDAFQDLVGKLDAGASAIGTAVFAFSPEVDPSGGWVTWDLVANDGRIYASGNAINYTVQSTGFSNTVLAQCTISVPSNVPPSLMGQSYQIRYTLNLEEQTPSGTSVQPKQYYTFENLEVLGYGTVPLGTQPAVEVKGKAAQLTLVTDKLYDNVMLEIFHGNTSIGQATILSPGMPASAGPIQTASGWLYEAVIQTSQMNAQVPPYTVLWTYWNSNMPSLTNTESTDLWVITPSIATAITDVKAKINKARTTLYGRPDLLFPAPTILTWLRRGMDAFNAYKGKFTSFNMTNAQGPIREWWLTFAELFAVEAQYLAEGEKAFDFQGQAIQLSVDQTQYLDNMAGKLQSRIDNEMDGIKSNLIIKGNTGGDGSQDPGKLQRGAMGTVGIAISPASVYNRYQVIYPTVAGTSLVGTS